MKRALERAVAIAAVWVGAGCVAQPSDGTDISDESEVATTSAALHCALPNNFPMWNGYGLAASYSTQGFVDKCGAFFTPQGTNGRACIDCHAQEAGWSMSAEVAQRMFWRSRGLAPLFNALDADRGGSDPVDTLAQRKHAYSMLLKGKFRRRQSVPADAEFEVVSVDDPFEMGSTTRFWFFRRAMPTANFRNHIVSWDGANTVGTDLHAGLARQVRGNITGAQQGPSPVDEAVVEEIVQFEKALSHAQLYVLGAGRLDAHGARGGPEHLSAQPLVAGPFDLFDAWADSRNRKRAQIARGQAVFNMTRDGRSCNGCHNAANDGQNVNGVFFDIGASRVEFAEPDMAIYTLRNLETGEIRQTTDGGRGWRTGRWADLDRFKSPSLRGVSARGEYLHNGIAKSLEEVVALYEESLGFDFTRSERKDLLAFLRAL